MDLAARILVIDERSAANRGLRKWLMYRHIYVPIENSDWSIRAIDLAVELGKAFGAKFAGRHVYAARLHE